MEQVQVVQKFWNTINRYKINKIPVFVLCNTWEIHPDFKSEDLDKELSKVNLFLEKIDEKYPTAYNEVCNIFNSIKNHKLETAVVNAD